MSIVLRKTVLPACGVLAALLFGLASSAKADDSLNYTDAGNSAAVTISVFGGPSQATIAGDYNIYVNSSKTPVAAFCVDVFDDIHIGEQWTAKKGLTFNLLPTTSYPHAATNIAAVDYIAQHYTPQPNAPGPAAAAAQLAIWDLVLGGHVTNNSGVYSWDTNTFQATAGFAAASDQADLGTVYAIEQDARCLPGSGQVLRTTSSGSTLWMPQQVNGVWSPTSSSYGREQDLISATLGLQPSATPEPGPIALLTGLVVSGALFAMGRRRRSSRSLRARAV